MMSSAPYLLLVILTYLSASTLGYVPVHERPVAPNRGSRPILPIPGIEEQRPQPINPVRQPFRGNSPTSTGYHPGGPSTGSGRPSLIPVMFSGVNKRLAVLESRNTAISRNYERLSERMSSLTGQMRSLQTVMRGMSPSHTVSALRSANLDLETRMLRLESDNEELREFLFSFEEFFNRLMSADPSTYDPEAAPGERLSRLHQYLGNAEAELITISRPQVTVSQTNNDDFDDHSQDGFDDIPTNGGVDQGFTAQVASTQNQSVGIMTASRHLPTGKDSSTSNRRDPDRGTTTTSERGTSAGGVHLSTTEADHLAAALEQLDERNRELTARLQTLERQASDSNPVVGQTLGTASHTSNNAITEELLNKVDLLEQVVALQASSILDDTTLTASRMGISSTEPRGRPGPGATGAKVATASTMNQDDVEIMKDVLQDARGQGSSSRKSAFSVARTRSLLGVDQQLQRIEFDHVFVNKGRDFVVNNSTFVCERPGYYFITFHLRSYDGRYLGVSLMKNDDVVTSVFTDADTRNVMEGQSVIVHLESGDNLYLLLGPNQSFGLHSNDSKYVTFSGFLIYGGY